MTRRGRTTIALALLGALAAGPAAAQAGYTEERMRQLQQTQADLARRLDQLQKQNQQLEQQMERMRAGYEQRIEKLEKTGPPAKPPPARPAAKH